MDINEWNSDTIEQRKQEKFCFLLTFSYTNDILRGGWGGYRPFPYNRFKRILHFTREKKFSPNISKCENFGRAKIFANKNTAEKLLILSI